MKSNLWGAKALAVSIILSVSTPVLAKGKMSCREVQKELFMLAATAVQVTSEFSNNLEGILLRYESAASQGNRMSYITDVRGKVGQINNVITISKDEMHLFLNEYKECFPAMKAADNAEIKQKLNSY